VPAAGNAARSRYASRVASAAGGFAWTLQFDATQPVLLQGQGGVSRKGPDVADVSRYYSEPQLAVQGELNRRRSAQAYAAAPGWTTNGAMPSCPRAPWAGTGWA